MGSAKTNNQVLFISLALTILALVFVSRALAAKMDRIPPGPIEGEYTGTESCARCHQKEAKEFEHSTHAKFSVKDDPTQGEGCEICHGPGSKHVEALGKGFMADLKKDPEGCFSCHPETKAEFSLQYHHPVLEGKMSCSDCHDSHSGDVLSGTKTALEKPEERCFKCHAEYRGPFVYEHDALDSYREGCKVCHAPHGSVNNKMVLANDNNLCMNCHYERDYPTRIGKWPHGALMGAPRLVDRGKDNCFKCHMAIHGSNFSPYLLTE
jgi:predicted CXXCH cytochrome family protein